MDRLEFKFASEELDAKTGEFAGYGAVFGNIDSHGDVIAPGAFKDTLADWSRRGALPAMKLMHGSAANPFTGSDLPIGRWLDMREDPKGLFVKGKLSGLDTDQGRFTYALMNDGALNALSIGYKAVKASRGSMPQVRRQLDALKLFEVSLLPEGSNPEAVVTSLKSQFQALGNEDWREIEAILRTKDLSRSDAVKAIAGFKDWLQRDAGESDLTPRDEDEAEIAALLRRNSELLSTR
jgi:HK97 family phage prohead protease